MRVFHGLVVLSVPVLQAEPSTLGLKTSGPEGGTVVAAARWGEVSFPVALPKRRAVSASCAGPQNLVQRHRWPPAWEGLFERCMDLSPHEFLSQSRSLSLWRLLETIFGWRVTLQRRLFGSQAWGGCVCRQVLHREGEESSHRLLWEQLVCVGISSVPSSCWRLPGIRSLGGRWACRTCSNPTDCGKPVGFVGCCTHGMNVHVWCPCQGRTGTNEKPFSLFFPPFLFLHTVSVFA